MRQKIAALKGFNWRLWCSLCALSLVPAVYGTVKTFLIASGGDSGVFDVIGQMEWFDLINETLQAFLIVPLYSILNKIYVRSRERFAENVFKTGAAVFVLYTLFSVGVLIYGSVWVSAMNPAGVDLAVTDNYLRLETVAFMAGITVSFVNVVFVVLGKAANVYIFLGVRTALSLAADLILIPNFGVYGVAVSNIAVNTVLSVASLALLVKRGCLKFSKFEKSDLPLFKEWARDGVFSGAQQFLDNFIYAVMVCKMVNMVAEQGNYWIANNFIWGWALIPVSALAEVVKADCKEGYSRLNRFAYRFITAGIIIFWIITAPLWKPFFRYCQGLQNADEIFLITAKLMPFYVAYAGCAVIDSIFVGLGRTAYNAVNSAIINIIYYGVFYILYLTKAITFTMNIIILMFGLGMVVHLIVSVVQERCFLRRRLA